MQQLTFVGLLLFFGFSDPSWALRDAVEYSGNYETMMKKNFPDYQLSGDDRGTRNVLNTGQPMMHAYPGLEGHVTRSNYCPGDKSVCW